MARAVHFPPGAWPLEMRAATAAGFCDEPSVEAFLRKVEAGQYPQPARVDGSHPKWHRARLEEAIARRHGLRIDSAPIAESIEGLI